MNLILKIRPTVVLGTFFCSPIGSLAQKRKTDRPVDVEIAEGSKKRRGHTNSANQRTRPLDPLTTCAWETEQRWKNYSVRFKHHQNKSPLFLPLDTISQN